MLDTETKRRIDTARDILVGKVPDPKSQVEQITIALIYKFMDDMDAESRGTGRQAHVLRRRIRPLRLGQAACAPGLGGHEILNLYARSHHQDAGKPRHPAALPRHLQERLSALPRPGDAARLPQDHRRVQYDHSERLGDAFEYLLSVLGSQGDAGQFRTPRHIIDFMVEVIDPKKNETVLDPACGTAGFLISSYKHILAGQHRCRRATAR